MEGCLKESESSENTGEGTWVELVGKSKTGPDKEHVYEIRKSIRVSHVKLTIIPDGGVKRIRVWGTDKYLTTVYFKLMHSWHFKSKGINVVKSFCFDN